MGAAVRCQRFVTPFLPIRSEQGALAGAAYCLALDAFASYFSRTALTARATLSKQNSRGGNTI